MREFFASIRKPGGTSLTTHLLAAMGIFVVLYGLWWAFGLRLSPLPWAIFTLLIGTLIWLLRTGPEPADTPRWVEHQALVGSPRYQSDLATRRIADMIVGAQPGREFSTHQLALTLRDLTAERLVQRHHADPEQPLTTATDVALSKPLLAYLSTVETGDSPSINRRTLHRHLKEIESL
ncbi:hypothetical protein [Aestuariimicrobium ganziense]|uniref:hypothetical protein n=1 Tax=Aestuariimicrobium ganziense TaxID=2773677 RepID=UPI00194134E1|nr:hypothetical protein [Aestuariimicrobium ganziense]